MVSRNTEKKLLGYYFDVPLLMPTMKRFLFYEIRFVQLGK